MSSAALNQEPSLKPIGYVNTEHGPLTFVIRLEIILSAPWLPYLARKIPYLKKLHLKNEPMLKMFSVIMEQGTLFCIIVFMVIGE